MLYLLAVLCSSSSGVACRSIRDDSLCIGAGKYASKYSPVADLMQQNSLLGENVATVDRL